LEIFNGVCRKTQSQKVKIETVKPANVITPNGDGKNDKFILDMLEEGWKIEIYDRNGALKFKSDNYQNDWGQDVNSGTYYYLLTSPSGKTCKGWVQVLKGE
jgi:gliding motility-associated-like protein